MIQAIIFDCFGVLAGDGWLPFKTKYFGHEPSLLRQATDLNRQSDSGLISYDEFVRRVAAMASIDTHAASKEIEDNAPNLQLLEYIAGLKPRYKIGMLSNAAANWLDDMFTPAQLALFDTVTLSYETGFVKPQAAAYRTAAERLGVDVADCVLIDDQERYCTGARDVGMQAICYKNADQATAELTKMLANPKD